MFIHYLSQEMTTRVNTIWKDYFFVWLSVFSPLSCFGSTITPFLTVQSLKVIAEGEKEQQNLNS